jgi:hypothetical protein
LPIAAVLVSVERHCLLDRHARKRMRRNHDQRAAVRRRQFVALGTKAQFVRDAHLVFHEDLGFLSQQPQLAQCPQRDCQMPAVSCRISIATPAAFTLAFMVPANLMRQSFAVLGLWFPQNHFPGWPLRRNTP